MHQKINRKGPDSAIKENKLEFLIVNNMFL